MFCINTSTVYNGRLCHKGKVCVLSEFQQEKAEMKRELWRIEDVMAVLSSSKVNYQITIDSVQNPGEKTTAAQLVSISMMI